jgi:hypothetical protein
VTGLEAFATQHPLIADQGVGRKDGMDREENEEEEAIALRDRLRNKPIRSDFLHSPTKRNNPMR